MQNRQSSKNQKAWCVEQWSGRGEHGQRFDCTRDLFLVLKQDNAVKVLLEFSQPHGTIFEKEFDFWSFWNQMLDQLFKIKGTLVVG